MRKKKKSKFPDLTGDGKVTRADILKGRGVIESEDFVSEVMTRVELNNFWSNIPNNSTLYEHEHLALDEILGGLKPLSESFAMDDLPLLAENTDLLEAELIQAKVEMISIQELAEIVDLQLESEGYYHRLTDGEIDSLLGEMLTNWSNGDGFRTDEGVENDAYSFLNEEQINEFLSRLFGGGKKFNRSDFRRKMRAKQRTMDGIARRLGKTPNSPGAKRYRKQKADRFEAAGGKVVRGGQQGSGAADKADSPKPAAAKANTAEAKPDPNAARKKQIEDRIAASRLKRQTDKKLGRGFAAFSRGEGQRQDIGDKAAKGDIGRLARAKKQGGMSATEKKKARASRDLQSTDIVRGARMALAEAVLNDLFKKKIIERSIDDEDTLDFAVHKAARKGFTKKEGKKAYERSKRGKPLSRSGSDIYRSADRQGDMDTKTTRRISKPKGFGPNVKKVKPHREYVNKSGKVVLQQPSNLLALRKKYGPPPGAKDRREVGHGKVLPGVSQRALGKVKK